MSGKVVMNRVSGTGRGGTKKVIMIALALLVLFISPALSSQGGLWQPLRTSLKVTAKRPVVAFSPGYNASVGINDNGSALYSGNVVNYVYGTQALLGYFAFYGGSFYSGSPINASAFSVQLNSNFNVTDNMTLWAQDVFEVTYNGSIYNVTIIDNLWNSTTSGASINPYLISGWGTTTTYNGITFYYDVAFNNTNTVWYLTQPPFYLYAMMNLTVNPSTGYPELLMYYRFRNSTYDSGWVLYDNITIYVPTNSSEFLVGVQPWISTQYPNYPFVTQWVVCGDGGGSQLYVYSWNATMALYYWYDGNWYSVPDAVSLQPLVFTAGVTGESVNQYNGIVESYNARAGLVYQSQGQNAQEFLWQPSVSYSVNGNVLTVYLTPPNGLWQVVISGSNGYHNQTFGDYSPISFTLQPGQYELEATLYAGPNQVVTINETVNVPG